MMAVVLFCRSCETANTFSRNWLEDDDACVACGAKGLWRTESEPKVVYDLSVNDRRFLRSLRIAPE